MTKSASEVAREIWGDRKNKIEAQARTSDELQALGYLYPRQLPDGRWVALQQMLYTTGLFVDLDEVGMAGRYCFERYSEALFSLVAWDGTGDPPGNWIKWKGRGGDRHNLNWKA